jgi:hypothetical protein
VSLAIVIYHEAAHIVAGFVLRIPLGSADISPDGGVVRMAWWYRAMRMFYPVSRQTVRRDLIWSLAGDFGEQLMLGRAMPDTSHDRLFLDALTRRFRLSTEELEREAWNIVFQERQAILSIAKRLETKHHFSEYDMQLLYMNWLAHGAARPRTSSIT